jgi:hypothetical protein
MRRQIRAITTDPVAPTAIRASGAHCRSVGYRTAFARTAVAARAHRLAIKKIA